MTSTLKPPATFTHAEALNWYAARIEEFAVGLREIADDLEGCKAGPLKQRPRASKPAVGGKRRGRQFPPPPPDTLARRVFDGRQKLGLSRRDLAAKAQLAVVTISGIEWQRHEPTEYTLKVLADALGTTAAELSGGAKHEHPRATRCQGRMARRLQRRIRRRRDSDPRCHGRFRCGSLAHLGGAAVNIQPYTCQEFDVIAVFNDGQAWLYGQCSAGGTGHVESARACNRELERRQKQRPTEGYLLYVSRGGEKVHDPRRPAKQPQRAVEQRSAHVVHTHEVGGSTPPGATNSEGVA